MAKKFSDAEIDEVLSLLEKFHDDGISYIHLKENLKKNFIQTKIPEFKLKDILVFLDENSLVQRIPFDDKPGFHDLTVYRISEKGKTLMKKFDRAPDDDWKKNSYSTNVVCQNCGYTFKVRVSYSIKVKDWAKTQRCYNCAHKGTFVANID